MKQKSVVVEKMQSLHLLGMNVQPNDQLLVSTMVGSFQNDTTKKLSHQKIFGMVSHTRQHRHTQINFVNIFK